MNTARLEVKMANNIQFSDLAFQAAESGIDSLLATGALKSELDTDPDDTTPFSQTYTLGAQSATATVRYITEGLAPGYSIGTPALHYRITSVGASAGGAKPSTFRAFTSLAPRQVNPPATTVLFLNNDCRGRNHANASTTKCPTFRHHLNLGCSGPGKRPIDQRARQSARRGASELRSRIRNRQRDAL